MAFIFFAKAAITPSIQTESGRFRSNVTVHWTVSRPMKSASRPALANRFDRLLGGLLSGRRPEFRTQVPALRILDLHPYPGIYLESSTNRERRRSEEHTSELQSQSNLVC